MENAKPRKSITRYGAVLLLAQNVCTGAAEAQTYDQTIGTSQTTTVNLVKPGSTVLVAPGVTVAATSGVGIFGASGDTWAITNQGSVTGASGSMAIQLQGAGSSVTNDGAVGSATSSHGVYASAGLSLTNHVAAAVLGSSFAVYSGNVLQLVNQGSIVGGSRAVYASTPNNGLGADISNSGLIQGSILGINISTGSSGNATNQIHNRVNGQILATATTGDAINLLHASTLVTNDVGATIDGGHSGILGSDLFTEVNVNNAGIIRGGTGAGIYSYGGGTISNQVGGTITGAGGVSFPRAVLNDTDIVTNAGTITGNATTFVGGNGTAAGAGAGIYFGGVYAPVGGLVNNLATGHIEGAVYGVYSGAATSATDAGPINVTNAGEIKGSIGLALNGANETIANTGTINGTGGTAILFDQTGAFNNALTLGTGSVLNGNVLGGPGTDALVLSGTGAEDGTKIRNFETLSTQGVDWTLTGTAVFSTSASIATGRLVVAGNLSSPAVAVKPAGTLAGTGTVIGNVINHGAIAPGDAARPGALTIDGNLTLDSSSALNVRLGQAGAVGGPLNDLINVSGDLVLAGTLNATRATGGAFGAGIYRIINYNGALTDNGLVLGSVPAGSDDTLQTSVPGQINLINAADLLLNYWDGDSGPKFNNSVDGGVGTWQASAGNDNWTNASGAINAGFSDGALAVFAGTPGTVMVSNSLGNVTVSGMQFATSGYRIQGEPITLASGIDTIRVGDGTPGGAAYTAMLSAPLTGTGGLTKTDLGTLVLTGSNSFTGGTSIQGGVLQVSSDANLGDSAGTLTFDGGTLKVASDFQSARNISIEPGGGTIDTQAYRLGLEAPLTGDGGLTKLGSGVLVLDGISTYAGATDIAQGALIVGDSFAGSTAASVAGAGITVQPAASLGGYGQVLGAVDNAGTLYAGNATPSLEGGPSGHFRIQGDLLNEGLVSLVGTSRGNTLTVGGSYNDPQGALIVGTKLDGTGPLGSQQTDRLLIEGNASGNTIIGVEGTLASNSLAGVLQSMALGSQPGGGISIVQVAGISAAGTFYLRNGYTALGPYRYELFAYAPGNSSLTQRAVAGSGNAFWDYRLQVGVVCENANCGSNGGQGDDDTGNGGGDGINDKGANGEQTAPDGTSIDGAPSDTNGGGGRSFRPALVPQMPAYLAAPTALLSYGLTQLSSLQDRLGDVRTAMHAPDRAGNATELFLRGIGGGTTYRSDVSFSDYGVGYTQRMTGVQIGGNWLGHDGDASNWRIGAALTKANDRIEPKAPDGRSVLKYDAANVALTGTWLNQGGWYVDAVVSRDIYQGSVTTNVETAQPNAHGWSASLEGGRSFTDNHQITWEPQAQVVWQSLGRIAFTDTDQLRVLTRIPDQWTGRLGLLVSRTFPDGEGQAATSTFARVNYVYSGNEHARTVTDGGLGSAEFPFGSGALGENAQLELGATRSLGARFSLYVNGNYQWRIQGFGAKGWGWVAGLRWTL